MPWRQTSYKRFYWFRRRMIWSLVVIPALVFLFFWHVVPQFILDPGYSPGWEDFRCKAGCRKGAFVIFLLFLFVLLPVWLKALTAGMALSEVLTRWAACLVWTFDRRPDFAIGPHGIYGVSGLRYRHIGWSNVTSVVRAVSDACALQSVEKDARAWWRHGAELCGC